MEQYDKAREDLRRALEVDPKHSRAYGSLAILSILDGDHAEALRLVEKMLAVDGNDADGHGLRGDLFAYDGEFEAACMEYEKAFDLAPDKSALVRFAFFQRAMQGVDGRPQLRRFLEERGEELGDWERALNEALIGAIAPEQLIAGAVAPKSKCLRDKRIAEAYYCLAHRHVHEGDVEKAIECLHKAESVVRSAYSRLLLTKRLEYLEKRARGNGELEADAGLGSPDASAETTHLPSAP
jgi:tetratricopeptide (TPR) repeat protein